MRWVDQSRRTRRFSLAATATTGWTLRSRSIRPLVLPRSIRQKRAPVFSVTSCPIRRIGHEVTENTGARFCRIDRGKTKGLIDRLRKVHPVVAVAAKEKRLVLLDWSTHLIAELLHPDQRLRIFLCVLIPLVGVERLVSQNEQTSAMKLAGPGAGRDRDRRAAVASFFRGGVVCGYLEFLDVIGSDPIEVAHRVWD